MPDPEAKTHEPPRINIENRQAMFENFVRFCGWAGLHVLLVTGYLTLVFAIGINWLVGLLLMALAGIAGGLLMKLGSAWYLSLVAQAVIVVIARFCVFLFAVVS